MISHQNKKRTKIAYRYISGGGRYVYSVCPIMPEQSLRKNKAKCRPIWNHNLWPNPINITEFA